VRLPPLRRCAQRAVFADAVPQPPRHHRACRRITLTVVLSMARNARRGRLARLWSSLRSHFSSARPNGRQDTERRETGRSGLKWMMDKASLNGLAFRRDIDFDVLPSPPPRFMHGAYKLLTRGKPFLSGNRLRSCSLVEHRIAGEYKRVD